jgi:hypothetical protein
VPIGRFDNLSLHLACKLPMALPARSRKVPRDPNQLANSYRAPRDGGWRG